MSSKRWSHHAGASARVLGLVFVGLAVSMACATGAFAQSEPVQRTALENQPTPHSKPAPPDDAIRTQPTTTPQQDQALEQKIEETPAAVVTEVKGDAGWSTPGTSPMVDEGWTAIVVGDRLTPQTIIRTGIRSQVSLRFGETTYISIRSATYASIDQFHRTATTERVRIGLGYGTVRGGSSEGEIHSDVIVDTPAATVVKRGTQGWQIHVEALSERFHISLARAGLVEAIQKLADGRRVSKAVRPGEYATQDNIANLWIDQEIFDRNVLFYAVEGMTAEEAGFAADNTRGYGVLAPGLGSAATELTSRSDAGWTLEQIEANFPAVSLPQIAGTGAGDGLPPTTVLLPISRPEGNFGTPDSYRVLLPRRAAGRR